MIGRSLTSLNGSAVSRISRICSAERYSSPTRSLPRAAARHSGPSRTSSTAVPAVELLHRTSTRSSGPGCHREPDDVGLDRQLPSAPIDQHREQDPPRPAEVGQLVERGAHGPAGVEHVVHDDDGLALEIVGKTGLADAGAAGRWSERSSR